MALIVSDLVGTEFAEKGLDSQVGRTEVFLSDIDKTIEWSQAEGWFLLGRTPTDVTTAFTPTYIDVNVGLPATYKTGIVSAVEASITASFDHFTQLAQKIAFGSSFDNSVRYASDGQTTVASAPTTTSATLTSGTGFAIGDMFEVEADATYAGTYFNETGYITSVSTNDVTYTALSQAPLATNDFLKVAGLDTGTGDSDMGISIDIGILKSKRFRMLIRHDNPCNSNIHLMGFHKVEVRPSGTINFNDGQALATIELEFKPISTKQTVIIEGVSTTNVPVFGESLWIPKES